MDLLSLKYGVLTTYDQSLFLRQAVVGGEWELQISPVKYHDDTSSTTTATVRECFWHVGQIASPGATFNRTIGASFQGQTMPWTID
jgi:hypothetical protein